MRFKQRPKIGLKDREERFTAVKKIASKEGQPDQEICRAIPHRTTAEE